MLDTYQFHMIVDACLMTLKEKCYMLKKSTLPNNLRDVIPMTERRTVHTYTLNRKDIHQNVAFGLTSNFFSEVFLE